MRNLSYADLPKAYKKQVQTKLAALLTPSAKTLPPAPDRKQVAQAALARPEVSSPSSQPHALLWEALRHLNDAHLEYAPGIEGRKFRLDIAFPTRKLAVEVDGWQFHGKFLRDFSRDRERQNLLTLHGWRILRFTAGQIRQDIQKCRLQVQQALSV